MKKTALLIVLSGWVLFSTAVQAATYDATGRWTFSISGHRNNCGEPPESNETGTAVMIQTANTFLIVSTSSTSGNLKTVSGNINGATYTYSDRYYEDGGWTNDTVTFTLSSSSSGSGTGSWNWAGGGYSCSGGYSVSMTMQSKSPPAYNASGTWNFNETGFWNNCGEANPGSASGTITINQNGSSISSTDDQGGTWEGFVNGSTYILVDSYAEDGGITSEVCTVNLSSASQGSGECWWVWDKDGDSNDNCQGGSNVSITKTSNWPGTLCGGWCQTWMGWVHDGYFPWGYHDIYGWIYIFGTDPNNLWFYNQRNNDYWWTTADLYPDIYFVNEAGWFYNEPGTNWFYSYKTGQWVQR